MGQLYNEYLHDHIENVRKGFDWLVNHNIVEPYNIFDVVYLLDRHDASKYTDEEYGAYDRYFYGTKSYETVENFNYAWIHHIHNNPHHWQYWVLQHDDEPEEVLELPKKYAIEMICDWWSFSWRTGKLNAIFGWYEKHKNMNMKLNPSTRKYVEGILNKMKEELASETSA